jgi:hypothetical protein
MTTITIPLRDEVLDQLREKAREVGVSPEELARAGLESWLHQEHGDFEAAAKYVFEKNAELYRRLS